jgi:amino acid transporter
MATRDRDDDRTTTDRDEGGREGGTGVRDVRARQRDEYGGINWGAAFFGWLVAVGMAAILTAIVSAAGAAIGLTEGVSSSQAETVSLIGAILLLLVLGLAYYCGGYVSGRMSRFDGARQGLGAWAIGIILTILLGILGAVAGAKYNVLAKFDAPRIPIDEGDLSTGGIITLIAILVLTALAAMAGGKAGERYHKKVDRTGFGV